MSVSGCNTSVHWWAGMHIDSCGLRLCNGYDITEGDQEVSVQRQNQWLWFVYRIIRGWVSLTQGEPMCGESIVAAEP
jgi:hypothetical protein